MKRNKQTQRLAKRGRTASGLSRYADKRTRPEDMMYGPGCCAHSLTDAQVRASKRRAQEEGRVQRSWWGGDGADFIT